MYSDERYIGSIKKIETLYNKFEIDVCVNFYIGILGSLQNLHQKVLSNPKVFEAAYKLENLLKFHQDIIFSYENKDLGKKPYMTKHKPVIKRELKPGQWM